MAARRQTPARAERAAIETVKVQINGSTLADYQDWEARAGALDDPRDELTGFSAWYAECEAEWIARAREVGLWRQAGRSEKSDARECRRRSETVGHLRRDDGLVVHFLVVAEEAATVFRARHCRTVPVFSLGQHWTDEQRLTWEEFIGGASCRGCGRGFVGAPEWKPVLTRSPEEAVAIEREEAVFRELHPDCHTVSWRYGPTGVTHCSECCPPPPLSPRQGEQIARIIADIVIRINEDEARLERRWAATGTDA